MEYNKICRKNGKVEQACDVYISRAYMGSGWNLGRSKWAIPNELCVLNASQLHDAYRKYIVESPDLSKQIPELAYQRLGCWCKDEDTCHAKVLTSLVRDYLNQQPAPLDSSYPSLLVERVPIYRVEKRAHKNVVVKNRDKAMVCNKSQPLAPLAPLAPLTSSVHLVGVDSSPAGLVTFISPMTIAEYWNNPPFNHPIDATAPPEPITIVNNSGLTVIYKPIPPNKPSPYDPSMFIVKLNWTNLVPKKNFAPNLHKSKTWDPFVCYVAKIIKNKKTERYMMILSDHDSTGANNENSVKVHVASQLFPAIQNKTIAKDDLIYVEHYTITQLGPRKTLIILCHVAKISKA
jgi:hypothetical protein